MEFSDSRVLYTTLVVIVASMRLIELAVSRSNISRLFDRGAVEAGRSLYPWMVAVHTGFLAACVAEVWLLERSLIPQLSAVMLGLLVLAAAIRWWVISTLGDRWSTRVVFVPGQLPVTGGPFRWLRHPNYLAVIIEFAALPLVHTAWWTAIAFSLANGAVLWFRVRAEESALAGSSEYLSVMGDRPRFYPGRK
jgi:methyltransferase